jgi:hypothetical protein
MHWMSFQPMAALAYRPLLTTRTTCRICGCRSFTDVIALGEQYIGGLIVSEDGTGTIKRQIPLDLVRCDPSLDENACGLVQMRHSVPPKVLYHRYYYESGINQSMRDNLAEISALAENTVKLGKNDIVLDIGCNDGTLLGSYKTQGLRHIGIESARTWIRSRKRFFLCQRLSSRASARKSPCSH